MYLNTGSNGNTSQQQGPAAQTIESDGQRTGHIQPHQNFQTVPGAPLNNHCNQQQQQVYQGGHDVAAGQTWMHSSSDQQQQQQQQQQQHSLMMMRPSGVYQHQQQQQQQQGGAPMYEHQQFAAYPDYYCRQQQGLYRGGMIFDNFHSGDVMYQQGAGAGSRSSHHHHAPFMGHHASSFQQQQMQHHNAYMRQHQQQGRPIYSAFQHHHHPSHHQQQQQQQQMQQQQYAEQLRRHQRAISKPRQTTRPNRPSPASTVARKKKGGRWQYNEDEDFNEDELEDCDDDDEDDEDYSPAMMQSGISSAIMSSRSRSRRPTAAKWIEERPKKGRRVGSDSGDDEDESGQKDGLSDDDYNHGSMSKRKVEVCVLDYPGLGCPDEMVIDRVVSHNDYWWDIKTDLVYEFPAANENELEMKVEGSEEVVRWTSKEAPTDDCEILRKYLIKWKGRCHLRNEHWTYADLVSRNFGGIKKVSNYIKKQEEFEAKKLHLSEDEIEQINISLELQRQLDQDALVPERVVTHRTVTDSDDSTSVQVVYLVKWVSTAYDQCTWELREFLLENEFEWLIKEYEEREDRIIGAGSSDRPLNQHDLGETSFEPYLNTPWYLGSANSELQLRDYQITGVNWIISRMKKDLSVLLADEMGLGKTAQTIGVIGHILYVEKIAGPILVIVPQSTMDNWLSEFRRWLPDCNVILYHGNPLAREVVRREEMKIVQSRSMSRKGFESFIHPHSRLSNLSLQELKLLIANRKRHRCDVVITTPSILQCPDDISCLRNISWYFMAVDEAHQLKNRESKRFKELCLFSPRYKLLLSGTPLHNNLEELWSLLHFMNPHHYHSISLFQQRYSEIEKTTSVGELKAKQLNDLQQELSQVVLRRVKKDVLKSLPNKVEWILRVELSPRQSLLCQDVVLRNYQALSKSTGGSKLSLQNICVELKKICNHPFLLGHNLHEDDTHGKSRYNEELVSSSGKMCLLDKLLARLKERGHRVLIFSQMVKMLNLLSTFLTLRGYKHQRLDGTMSRDVRKKAMDHFNAPSSDDFCFLLSTKAGGLGINLTSADTVIIYDSDWNPQNDLQAEARAHRIGQTKTVQIYRIVTKDTVEEEILERAKAKMVLDALVVQGLNQSDRGGSTGNGSPNSNPFGNLGKKDSPGFTREELSKILKFGATKLWTKTDDAPTDPAALAAGEDIDLDTVLAEAEQQTDSSLTGRAADLLNSFSNVSDFRYQAPKPRPEDKLTWDAVVPLEHRLKFQAQQQPETKTNGSTRKSSRPKRSTRPTKQIKDEDSRQDEDTKQQQLPDDESLDEEEPEEDDDDDELRTSSSTSRRKIVGRRRTKRTTPLANIPKKDRKKRKPPAKSIIGKGAGKGDDQLEIVAKEFQAARQPSQLEEGELDN